MACDGSPDCAGDNGSHTPILPQTHPNCQQEFPIDTPSLIPHNLTMKTSLADHPQKACINVCYKPSYRITRSQLEYLGEQAKRLQRLTKKLCQQEITSFAEAQASQFAGPRDYPLNDTGQQQEQYRTLFDSTNNRFAGQVIFR